MLLSEVHLSLPHQGGKNFLYGGVWIFPGTTHYGIFQLFAFYDISEYVLTHQKQEI
jgi:hypothetical protein